MQVKKQQNPVWNNWLVQDWERSMTGLSVVTFFIENLFAEHIMRHVWLGELHTEIKIGGKNINNFRYTDDT